MYLSKYLKAYFFLAINTFLVMCENSSEKFLIERKDQSSGKMGGTPYPIITYTLPKLYLRLILHNIPLTGFWTSSNTSYRKISL